MARPIHECRLGLVKACIRRKRTHSGHQYSVSVVRLYRNGDVWKESTRFGRDDLPVLRLVLDQAHTWILLDSQNTQQPRSPKAR